MQPAPNEIQDLRRCVRDLAALSTLHAIWDNADSTSIGRSLADVLLRILSVDFLYVRLHRPDGGPPIEAARARHRTESENRIHEIGQALEPWLLYDNTDTPPSIPNPVGEGMVRLSVFPIGHGRDHGLLAAGCERQNFPTDTERLLLGVAVNQAASLLRRKQAEEELRKQSEWLRVTLASIGDAVITTDAQGRVSSLNQVAASLTGWTLEEAAGQPLATVFRIVNEQTHQPIENPVATVLREGRIVGQGNHTVLIARDGTERPIDDSAAPIRGPAGEIIGVVLIFRDVTEQRHADWELRQSEARKAAILATALDCIITCDHHGLIVDFNPAAERTFGYSRNEALGRDMADLIIPASLRERHRKGMDRNLATGQATILNQRIEMLALRADGTEFPIELTITRISTDGPPLFTAYLRDISQRKRQERHRNTRLAVTQVLAQATTIREAARSVLQAVCDNLGWDLGLLWMLQPNAEALICLGSWHRPGLAVSEFEASSRRRIFRKGEGLPGRVWVTGKPSWVPDVLHDTNFPRIAVAAKEELHGAFGCPITLGGDTLGVIEFFSQRVSQLDADLLEMMTTIAGQIGQFMERMRAEEERDRFFTVGTDMLVVAGFDGYFQRLNPAWEKVLGWTAEELTSQPWLNFVHPDDWEATKAETGRLVRGEETISFENRYRTKSGEYRWLSWKAKPYPEERLIYGGATDITQRKRHEEALRLSEQRWRTMTEALPNLVWTDLPNGECDWLSSQWGRYTGIPESELLGLRWLERVIHPDDRERTLECWRAACEDRGAYDLEYRIRRHDGEYRWFKTRGVPVRDEQCRIIYWFGTCTDIEDHKRAEEALKETDRRKDEFLATLAHELRNPLAPIRNSLQILKIPQLDAETLESSREIMERQVHHLVRLVDDLLDVSRVMRGKVRLHHERVELSSVVARAVETAQPLIESQGHELTVSLPQESLYLHADPVRLAQVVGNLLTNAAKYTEPNGRIWLTAEAEGKEAVLRVRDTGIGIEPEMLPKIFDLFVQVEPAETRSQGGLGIGLTLVKNLVEMHHGTVQVTSAGWEKGSEFIVRLPLMRPMVQADGQPDGSEGGEQPQQVSSIPGLRLLVVDDNKDAAQSLATLLRLQGHEVQVAHDGPAALEMARVCCPEVIFLDIGMPGMDGYEVARQLRQIPDLEQVVLAALTGWGQQEDRRRSREAGFNLHLVKPVDPAALEKLLAEMKSETA